MSKIEIVIKIDGEQVATHGVFTPASDAAAGPASGEIAKENVEWVINELGEIGVSINGASPFFCYKGASFRYDNQVRYRSVGKREIGESHRIEGYVEGTWQFNPEGKDTKLT